WARLDMASVRIGRNRVPPDEIRWLATSGIIVTCDPVRDRIVALTRCMSAATRSARRSILAGERLSKGTMTATRRAPKAGTGQHRNAMVAGQVRRCTLRAPAWGACFLGGGDE